MSNCDSITDKCHCCGVQMMGKEDKATLDACKAMCSQGEWPPLMVTHDRRQG